MWERETERESEKESVWVRERPMKRENKRRKRLSIQERFR